MRIFEDQKAYSHPCDCHLGNRKKCSCGANCHHRPTGRTVVVGAGMV